jgi:hypothetical protein
VRAVVLVAAAVLALAVTLGFEPTDANAVVCARGVYRAGCAEPRGLGPQADRDLHKGVGQRCLRRALHLTGRAAAGLVLRVSVADPDWNALKGS